MSVAVLDDDLPGFDRAFVRLLAAELGKVGCDVATLSASRVCDPAALSAEKYFLYVIPQCRTYPAAGLEPLIAYASRQGHVLFLGGPFLDDPVWPANGGWFNRAAIRRAKDGAAPQYGPFGQEPLSAAGWQRTCNDPSTPGSWEVVPEGPRGEPCFRFWTKNLTNWDGYLSPDIPQLFGAQHALLSFLVKGQPDHAADRGGDSGTGRIPLVCGRGHRAAVATRRFGARGFSVLARLAYAGPARRWR